MEAQVDLLSKLGQLSVCWQQKPESKVCYRTKEETYRDSNFEQGFSFSLNAEKVPASQENNCGNAQIVIESDVKKTGPTAELKKPLEQIGVRCEIHLTSTVKSPI